MLFAYLGLVAGVAGAGLHFVTAPTTALRWVLVASYGLGGVFWFSLCSVLVETLQAVEDTRREVTRLRQ